jgi:acyl transferase domain-containing protein
VAPVAVVGHSSGEIAAAYTIGALSHESACKVAYFRGQLAGRLVEKLAASRPGAMLSVNLTASEVSVYLEKLAPEFGKGSVNIACFNSPTNLTLSGHSKAIDALKRRLDQKGIFAHKVNTGVAYHSPAMRTIAAACVSAIGTLEADYARNGPQTITMFSTLTGQEVAPKVLEMPHYWGENLASPVRFVDAIQRMAGGGTNAVAVTDLVEIGPHAALKRPVKESARALRYLSAMERNKSPLQTTLALLGTLFCHGHAVSVLAGNSQEQGRMSFLVDCPRYPFDNSRVYWHESRLSKEYRFRTPSPGYLIGRRVHDWNPLQPRWRNWLCAEITPWLGDHRVSSSIPCSLHHISLSFPTGIQWLI